MKTTLFLSFLFLSSISIGQVQETVTQETINPQLQHQHISKVNKIDKRVKPVRAKKIESPQKKEEIIKKD
jgi:hypothetical protein